jgi:hypothetical protein
MEEKKLQPMRAAPGMKQVSGIRGYPMWCSPLQKKLVKFQEKAKRKPSSVPVQFSIESGKQLRAGVKKLLPKEGRNRANPLSDAKFAA